ncbi:hypothetical protein BLOT_014493 [Blomia tropicalis]|nr:hypothetical protein BLOT_014493 [Blomia tropicalis]
MRTNFTRKQNVSSYMNGFFPRDINKFNYIRHASTQTKSDIPVIRIPKYLEDNVGKTIYKEHMKVKQSKNKWHKTALNQKFVNKLIISSSGDKKLNHYHGFRYDPDKLPLISQKWFKQHSIGEKMTFHSFDENPSLMESFQKNDLSFESIGLDPNIVHSIYGLINHGSSIKPSSIQFGVIPVILQKKNVLFSAETGSGKTIAYLAPIIQLINQYKRCNSSNRKSPFGLVLLPSRELTEQVDLYRLNYLKHIVLDEADTLLDDTFSGEVVDILGKLNLQSNSTFVDSEETYSNGTQLICASATMPSTFNSTLEEIIDTEEDIEKVTTEKLHTLHPNVKHVFYRIHKYDRENKLIELIMADIKKKKPVIIFANRTNAVEWLANFLNENDIRCVRLTSKMSEEERFNSFRSFQDGEYDILVSTDLGSRGLDTTRVLHVINFDCPHYVSDYIHRAGRTGRLGSNGPCLVSTLVSYKQDKYMLVDLEKAIRLGTPIKNVDANIKSQISKRWADKRNKLQRDL